MLSSGGDVTSISCKKTKDTIKLATFENCDTETFTSLGWLRVHRWDTWTQQIGYGFPRGSHTHLHWVVIIRSRAAEHAGTTGTEPGRGPKQTHPRSANKKAAQWEPRVPAQPRAVQPEGAPRGTTECHIPRDPAPRCRWNPAVFPADPELTGAHPRPPAPGPGATPRSARPQPVCAYGPADEEASTAGRRGSAMPRDPLRSSAGSAGYRPVTGPARGATVWELIGTDRGRRDARPLEGTGTARPRPSLTGRRTTPLVTRPGGAQRTGQAAPLCAGAASRGAVAAQAHRQQGWGRRSAGGAFGAASLS